ncbi:hypothetical protein M427DRAFT_188390, partial [Gonapodya prolifera JEL478]
WHILFFSNSSISKHPQRLAAHHTHPHIAFFDDYKASSRLISKASATRASNNHLHPLLLRDWCRPFSTTSTNLFTSPLILFHEFDRTISGTKQPIPTSLATYIVSLTRLHSVFQWVRLISCKIVVKVLNLPGGITLDRVCALFKSVGVHENCHALRSWNGSSSSA